MWSMLRTSLVCFMLLSGSAGASEAGSSGSFGVLADIHFDPFQPTSLAEDLRLLAVDDWMAKLKASSAQPAQQRGMDTGPILLLSALSAIADRMAGADFVIVAGDLLSHRFGHEADVAPDTHQDTNSFPQKTAAFVMGALMQALPGKPIIIALGNNDSDCGDYAIEPGGDFLAATMETVRTAIGQEYLSKDFEDTYRAGGYYEVRHPTVENAKIIVLNDTLWSIDYQNRCGNNALTEADEQLKWLESQLEAQHSSGGFVWIVHHIPWGIDAYSTLDSKSSDCVSGIVPFLRDEVSATLFTLLRRYSATIVASFSGHTHFDDFRLILDGAGNPAIIDKMLPAISPIFGQDPGFLVFSYDTARGTPLDYTSYRLANLESLASSATGDWQEQYIFSQTYAHNGYSPKSISQILQSLDEPGAARNLYYNQRTGLLREEDYTAYACAIAHVDTMSYSRCQCGAAP